VSIQRLCLIPLLAESPDVQISPEKPSGSSRSMLA
jgi:hypothetical protein